MKNTNRDLVEYIGLICCPLTNNNIKQTSTEEIVCIPTEKPDIEQLEKVWIEGVVEDYEIVKTPIGTSLEGQNLTGYKLLVCGDIKLKIQYVANFTTQPVHTAHFKIPFANYLVLPKKFNPNSKLNVSILIEDVYSNVIDLRCIYNNITMMLVADIC